MTYPKCFNSLAEHEAWVALAWRSGVAPDWPCIDCTRAYQQQMLAAGRCEHPEAIPGKHKPCPVPSADDKPEASSGKPRKRGRKAGAKASGSARSVAKPCSENSVTPRSEDAVGRKRRRSR